MMTSPLGLVPRDLEDVWPAANYDVPVTGKWSKDELERVQRMLLALVQRTGHHRVINHTAMDLSFLDVEVVDTRGSNGATHHDALARLTDAVKDAKATFDLKNQKTAFGSKNTSRALHEKPPKPMHGARTLPVRKTASMAFGTERHASCGVVH